jgi:MFS transporter, ACS family, allantoate permease
LIIKGFGYDAYETILMGLPASGFQLLAVLLSALATSNIRKSRTITMMLIFLMGMAGILMIKLVPEPQKLTRLAGFWLVMAIAPAFPLMLSLAASNVAGFTKKSITMAMIFVAYCGGNWAGPQFFIATEAPNYHVSPRPYTYDVPIRSGSEPVLTSAFADCIHNNTRMLRDHGRPVDHPETLLDVGEFAP